MSVAERLQKAMDTAGLTPAELSRRSGVPQGRLSQIITGKTPHPRWDTISKLSKALGITENWLFTGECDMRAPPGDGPLALTNDQRELLDMWAVADEITREHVWDMLKKSSSRSRENVGGGSDSADRNSA
jgi:transcriptional regulator with XRE-family HTH domain